MIALLIGLAAVGAQIEDNDAPLTPEEIIIACAAAPAAYAALALGGDADYVDVEREKEFSATTANWTWKKLPRKLRCGSRTLHFRRGIYDNFLNAIAISPDCKKAAIAGGWLGGPTFGNEGYCLFEKGLDGWQRLGCVADGAV